MLCRGRVLTLRLSGPSPPLTSKGLEVLPGSSGPFCSSSAWPPSSDRPRSLGAASLFSPTALRVLRHRVRQLERLVTAWKVFVTGRHLLGRQGPAGPSPKPSAPASAPAPHAGEALASGSERLPGPQPPPAPFPAPAGLAGPHPRAGVLRVGREGPAGMTPLCQGVDFIEGGGGWLMPEDMFLIVTFPGSLVGYQPAGNRLPSQRERIGPFLHPVLR